MRFTIISTTYKKAVKNIAPTLKGRVFHVTNTDNFVEICKTGAIENNHGGRRKPNWTKNYYFANKGCVSVVDLLNNDKPRATKKLYLSDYQIFEQFYPVSVFLFLSPKIHHNLITWVSWRKEKAYEQKVVPNLESGYPGNILLQDIEEAMFITLTDRVMLHERIKQIYQKQI